MADATAEQADSKGNVEVNATQEEGEEGHVKKKKQRKFDLAFKLAVAEYAEQHSGLAAARRFDVDRKRVREWRKVKGEMASQADGVRSRLAGGGRKKASEELEEALCGWIRDARRQNLRVSRSAIRLKAKALYSAAGDKRGGGKAFLATTGWLNRFLRRNGLSLGRTAADAQTGATVEDENGQPARAEGEEEAAAVVATEEEHESDEERELQDEIVIKQEVDENGQPARAEGEEEAAAVVATEEHESDEERELQDEIVIKEEVDDEEFVLEWY